MHEYHVVRIWLHDWADDDGIKVRTVSHRTFNQQTLFEAITIHYFLVA